VLRWSDRLPSRHRPLAFASGRPSRLHWSRLFCCRCSLRIARLMRVLAAGKGLASSPVRDHRPGDHFDTCGSSLTFRFLGRREHLEFWRTIREKDVRLGRCRDLDRMFDAVIVGCTKPPAMSRRLLRRPAPTSRASRLEAERHHARSFLFPRP